jgi:hypothetical protein
MLGGAFSASFSGEVARPPRQSEKFRPVIGWKMSRFFLVKLPMPCPQSGWHSILPRFCHH